MSMCLNPAAKAAFFNALKQLRRHKTHKTLVFALHNVFHSEGGIFHAKDEYSLLLLSNQRHISRNGK